MSKCLNKHALHAEPDALEMVLSIAERTGETKTKVLSDMIRYAYSRARFKPVQIIIKEKLCFEEDE